MIKVNVTMPVNNFFILLKRMFVHNWINKKLMRIKTIYTVMYRACGGFREYYPLSPSRGVIPRNTTTPPLRANLRNFFNISLRNKNKQNYALHGKRKRRN